MSIVDHSAYTNFVSRAVCMKIAYSESVTKYSDLALTVK